jgi:DNA-binding response OmpR family regulator
MAKILVIDDDDRLRRMIGRALRRGGHEVAEAEDGVAGLRLFHADRPDIIVIDIVMPGKEGIETIGDLRRESLSLPILAMSGGSAGSEAYLRFAHMLGADVTLAKPFRPEHLLHEIGKLLLRSPLAM